MVLGQATVGRAIVPAMWSQIAKQMIISVRYSVALSRWRRGRKWGEMPLNAARNHCPPPTVRLRELPGQTRRAAPEALKQPWDLLPERLPRTAPDREDQPPYTALDDHPAAVRRHVRQWHPYTFPVATPHTGHGTGTSRVRAVTRTTSPPSTTSSTTNADSPESTTFTTELASCILHDRS